MSEIKTTPLKLVAVEGPKLAPLEIAAGGGATLGRSINSDHLLSHDSVSRRHASVSYRAGRWIVSDLASRHGTTVNGLKLDPHHPMPLAHADLLQIGPWTFRIELEHTQSSYLPTTDDRGTAQRVEPVSGDESARIARSRLESLIDCAALINGAKDEQELADVVLKSALSGTGFHRAALLRQMGTDEQVDVIGYRSRSSGDPGEASFSRSLLREAARTGQVVRLTSDELPELGVSIVQLGIASAICAPIHLGSSVDALLYLDAREGERTVESDAGGFCQAIARMCGLALSNLKRLQLEERQRRLESEVDAAREAQKMIVPEEEGEVGGLRYSFRMRPGNLVAGDLFDIVKLPDGRVAIGIGDVTGEGVGAAVIMTATQSHLHASLRASGDLSQAITVVNRYIARRTGDDKFVSLWLGIFDPASGKLTYVDAGHGHWLHKPAGDHPARVVPHNSGLLLGIDPDLVYETEEMQIASGDRMILFSDGVIEQASPSGERFGRERLIEVLNASGSVEEDVARVLDTVVGFAEEEDLADDTTVASIEVLGPRG